MNKQLSIILLMVVVAMYGCITTLATLMFQIKSYQITHDISQSTYWITLAVQVISAPMLIRLSDSIGRNAVMTISFAGALIGLTNLLFANSILQLAVGYVMLGITTTGAGCFNAYCCDQSSNNRGARSAIFATTTAAWAVGYVAALKLQETFDTIDENFPIYIGILIAVVAIMLALFALPITPDNINRTPFNLKEGNIIGASRLLFANRTMATLTIAMLLFFLGIRAYSYVQLSFLRMRYEGARPLAEIVSVQQLSTVLIAILAFVLILVLGKTKTVIVSLTISIVGIIGILYAPMELQRTALLLPLVGDIAGAVFIAMMADRISPTQYGVIFGGITGLTIAMELVSSLNSQLFEYLKGTSPNNLLVCAIIPALILLISLLVFLTLREVPQEAPVNV